jgi:hypothetical protein
LRNASVRAAGRAVPLATSSSVVETAIVERRAMPRAPSDLLRRADQSRGEAEMAFSSLAR